MSTARRRVALDVGLGLAALAFGAFSLCFPLGRDQGLYFYVGREWALHGSIPYRDVFDHKTPGIYVIHALAVTLFGDVLWGFRLLELLVAMALGLVAASLTASRGAAPRPGIRGAAVLAACVLHWGFSDFWNTGQSEIWYATSGLLAVAIAVRSADLRRAAAGAGLASGVALIFKPPAVWLVLLASGIVLGRAVTERAGPPLTRLRRAAVAIPWLAFGTAIPLAIMFGYFGAQGALDEMLEIVVHANAYYIAHEGAVREPHEILAKAGKNFATYVPLVHVVTGLFFAVVAHDLGRRNRAGLRRAALTAAVVLSAVLAVAMQGKYYLLHWGCMLAGAVLTCAVVADRFAELTERHLRRPQLGVAAAVAALVGSYALTTSSRDLWYRVNLATWRYVTGAISREAFTTEFTLASEDFPYHDSELVGLWLEQHSTPEDYVVVRGFQPEIYSVAHRRAPGRFFWTTFIVSPLRAYRRAEWLDEDRLALAQRPPRYVVTLTYIREGPDSNAWFLPLGYVPRYTVQALTVMERAP